MARCPLGLGISLLVLGTADDHSAKRLVARRQDRGNLGLTAWSKKGIMSRRVDNPVILIHHWRWLEANGYKRQAASCKRQAASLTRKHYNDIREIKGESIYENK